MALARPGITPLPPVTGGATPPVVGGGPYANPFPVGSSPAFRPPAGLSPILPLAQNTVPAGTLATPGHPAYTGQFGPALINHLRQVYPTNSGLPGHIGPPLPPVTPPVDPYPVGFPNLQALIDYFRSRYT